MTAEEQVRAAFEAGAPERLADVGGTDLLRGRADELALSAFMPDLLSLALTEVAAGMVDREVEDFVLACVGVSVGPDAVRATDYKDAMEALAATTLPDGLAERCQDVLVGRVNRRSDHEVARWVALGAALQVAVTRPVLRYALVGALVRLKVGEDPPEFLRRAAKVAGVAMSHWPDPCLAETLERLSQDEGARDEALFELGMASLQAGLDAVAAKVVDASFEAAREHFALCLAARENRPDARAYSTALRMLTALRRGDPVDGLRHDAETIRREVVLARAWSQPIGPTWGWMGARWTELFRWQDLAMEVAAFGDAAGSAAWVGAEVAIRRRLLCAYVANRSVLGRGAGGVETFVKPHIEARLLGDEVACDAAVSWLVEEARSPSSPWCRAAAELLAEVRARGAPAGKWTGAATPA